MNNEELNREKGRRLKECILGKYDSLRQFALHVTEKGLYSLSPGNLSAMLKGDGKRAITRDFAHVVAPLLNVSEHYLMCETDVKELLPWDNETSYSGLDILVLRVTRLLEHATHSPICFYTLPRFIEPPKAPISDLISKHRENVPRKYQSDNAYILRHIMLETPLFPSEQKELSEVMQLPREKQNSFYCSDFASVRKKATIDTLSGFTTLDNSCLFRDNNTQSEVIIECISVNDKLMSYAHFIALVETCSKMVVSLFESETYLETIDRLPNL